MQELDNNFFARKEKRRNHIEGERRKPFSFSDRKKNTEIE